MTPNPTPGALVALCNAQRMARLVRVTDQALTAVQAARDLIDAGAGAAGVRGGGDEDGGERKANRDAGDAVLGEFAGVGASQASLDDEAVPTAELAKDALPTVVNVPCTTDQLASVLSYLYTGTVQSVRGVVGSDTRTQRSHRSTHGNTQASVPYLTELGDAATRLGLPYLAQTCTSACKYLRGDQSLQRARFGDGKRFQVGKPVELARDLALIPHMCALSVGLCHIVGGP